MMPTSYRWRGELIADIQQWARERGEKMVIIRCVPEPYANPITGQVHSPEPYEQEMPESFWNGMVMTGVQMHEVSRYDPNDAQPGGVLAGGR